MKKQHPKVTITCSLCGTSFRNYLSNNRKFCSLACAHKGRIKRVSTRAAIIRTCLTCKQQFDARNKQIYCSRKCAWIGVASRPEKQEWGRAGARAVWNNPETKKKLMAHLHGDSNPFRNPIVQAKAKMALAAKGFAHLNGGNGCPLPLPQQILTAATGWTPELVIVTHIPKGHSLYPPCYKVDLGNAPLKIGIEVDGDGHNSPKARLRDAKKQTFLESLGWLILRYKNKEVLEELPRVLAEIASITSKHKGD